MSKLVTPQTYWTGYTALNEAGIHDYLQDTDQLEFWEEIQAAYDEGLSDGEILCSFYAKLCYAALTTKVNKNISKIRSIYDNILGTVKSGHGSVFEHCNLNFVTRNCSRVFTHELVRHRAGTAFSQTSGRYVRTDNLAFVHDPILDPVKDRITRLLDHIQEEYKAIENEIGVNDLADFGKKKKITSAMRRVLPNGQANEIGFSVNLRALRHTITMRTSRHAEWEIRLIFNQVYELVNEKYPAIFEDSIIEEVEGLREIRFRTDKI